MNTAKLKKYAPQARREFITAVSKQLNQLGIYSDKQISEAKQEGSVLLIEGKTFEPSVKTARERLVKKVQAMGYKPARGTSSLYLVQPSVCYSLYGDP